MKLTKSERDYLVSDLRKILGFTTLGGIKWQNVVLAQKHAKEWQSIESPGVATPPDQVCVRCGSERDKTPECETCGSTAAPITPSSLSMVERAERIEALRVAKQAARDDKDLARLIPEFEGELVVARYAGLSPSLAKTAKNLAEIVTRCVRIIDHDNLPGPPGCKSCARIGSVKGKPGHFEPLSVQERYAAKGLCSWCGRHTVKNVWPPKQAVEIKIFQGEHQAGRWLARNEKKLASIVDELTTSV